MLVTLVRAWAHNREWNQFGPIDLFESIFYLLTESIEVFDSLKSMDLIVGGGVYSVFDE